MISTMLGNVHLKLRYIALLPENVLARKVRDAKRVHPVQNCDDERESVKYAGMGRYSSGMVHWHATESRYIQLCKVDVKHC
jgi:hypothetical protein